MVKIVQINLCRSPSAVGYLNDLISDENFEIALIQEPHTFQKIISKLHSNGRAYSNANGNDIPRACVWININLTKFSDAIQLLEYSVKDCVAI